MHLWVLYIRVWWGLPLAILMIDPKASHALSSALPVNSVPYHIVYEWRQSKSTRNCFSAPPPLKRFISELLDPEGYSKATHPGSDWHLQSLGDLLFL